MAMPSCLSKRFYGFTILYPAQDSVVSFQHIIYTAYFRNKHLYIHCPKNTKSDIDGIIDYLAEANHDILVGFSEENRLKVQAIQGKPLHVERLLAWKKRIKCFSLLAKMTEPSRSTCCKIRSYYATKRL